MRPEYLQHIQSIASGWTGWLVYIAPALVIWIPVFVWKFTSLAHRFKIGWWSYVIALVVYWLAAVGHAEYLYAAKRGNMETIVEQFEYQETRDLENPYANAIPRALFYCTFHALLAMMMSGVIDKAERWGKSRHREEEAFTDLQETDYKNPYASPRVR